MDTTEHNKATVRRLYEQIVYLENLDLLDEIFDENYTGVGIGNGPSAFADAIRQLQLAFSDLVWTVHDVFAEGDKVAARWTWKGTQTGMFRGFPASGKVIQNDANVIYQFRNGKITHSWLQSDRLGVLQQIGAIS
ncbi:ester cyclase [Spirosoma harenae]